MYDERQDRRLTRGDFPDAEAWARYLHEGGLEPDGDAAVSGPGWSPMPGCGQYASLYRAIHGHTRRQNARAWGGWGVTGFVRNRDFMKVYDAVRFANRKGLVMNASVHISWSTVGVTGDEAVAEANEWFLELLRKWLHQRKLPKAWFWVLERGERFGLHSHVAVHVPYIHEGLFEDWVDHAVRTIAARAPVRDRRRRVFTIKVRHAPDRTLRAQWLLFRYVMKGMAPGTRVRNPENRHAPRRLRQVAGLKPEPQGKVATKRVGVARAIDRAARIAAAGEGLPPCPLRSGADTPREIFTDADLCWHDDQRRRRSVQTLINTFT